MDEFGRSNGVVVKGFKVNMGSESRRPLSGAYT